MRKVIACCFGMLVVLHAASSFACLKFCCKNGKCDCCETVLLDAGADIRLIRPVDMVGTTIEFAENQALVFDEDSTNVVFQDGKIYIYPKDVRIQLPTTQKAIDVNQNIQLRKKRNLK